MAKKHHFRFLQGNACLFGFCDNGGTCVEDANILECYRCQCPPNYTGRICDSIVAIIRTIYIDLLDFFYS